MFMLPSPLHPAVVHFPIVLALLLPFVLAGGWFAIHRYKVSPTRAWFVAVAFSAALFLATWASVRTGQAQEDTVEDAVGGGRVMHEHEEAAERLFLAAGLLLVLTPLGLLSGRAGQIGRGATALASLVAVAAMVPVGRSGGDLVYRHGAAQAYVATVGAASGSTERTPSQRERNRGSHEREGDESR
jgi:uncharacterized membrane protein